MSAAVRLWWLLRSTSAHPRTVATGVAFGLVTWCLLSVVGLLDLAGHADTLDRVLLGALQVLVLALALTAGVTVRSMLRCGRDRRLSVLRAAGASRAQTALVCGLEVADSAAPGVLTAVVAHAALWWLVSRTGADVSLMTPLLVLPSLLLVAVLGVVVVARMRASAS